VKSQISNTEVFGFEEDTLTMAYIEFRKKKDKL